MKRLFTGALLLLLSWGAFAQYQREAAAEAETNAPWAEIAAQRRQLFNWTARAARCRKGESFFSFSEKVAIFADSKINDTRYE